MSIAKETFQKSTRLSGVSRLPGLQKEAAPASVWIGQGSINALKDRRKRRRATVNAAYSSASVRILSRTGEPLDGHVIDLSETGIRLELDEIVAAGEPVTVEFMVADLGRERPDGWQTFVAAAEVMRVDDLADFPGGPYRTAFHFLRIPTMAQAQIARYVATRPVAD